MTVVRNCVLLLGLVGAHKRLNQGYTWRCGLNWISFEQCSWTADGGWYWPKHVLSRGGDIASRPYFEAVDCWWTAGIVFICHCQNFMTTRQAPQSQKRNNLRLTLQLHVKRLLILIWFNITWISEWISCESGVWPLDSSSIRRALIIIFSCQYGICIAHMMPCARIEAPKLRFNPGYHSAERFYLLLTLPLYVVPL